MIDKRILLNIMQRGIIAAVYAVLVIGPGLTEGVRLHNSSRRGRQGGEGSGTARDLNETPEFELPIGNEVGPIFRPTQSNITVAPGDRAVLKCRVDNLGTRTLAWKRKDDVHPLTIGLFTFAPDSRITVDYNQRSTEWNLIIQDVRPTDEGVYQCTISSKDEHETYDIRLNVKNVQVTGSDYVERGSVVRLVCNATGKPNPPHDVTWFKDDNPVISDARNGIIVTKKIETKVLVSMLVIKNSRMTDSGMYECRSSNQESSNLRVHILNVPSTPVEKRGTMSKMAIGSSLFGSTSTSTRSFSSTVLLLSSFISTTLSSYRLVCWTR